MAEIFTEIERDAICALARGDKTQLEVAIAAFNRAAPGHGIESCAELKFMAEVLAPVPDLMLRSKYRAELLKQSR